MKTDEFRASAQRPQTILGLLAQLVDDNWLWYAGKEMEGLWALCGLCGEDPSSMASSVVCGFPTLYAF